MAQTLQLANYPTINLKREGTKLDADVLKTATSIIVQNTAEFVVDEYLLIGNIGTEISELVTIKTITSATALELNTALVLDHKRYDSIITLNGNQIQVYRAPNVDGTIPDDSTFVALGSPFSIQIDQSFTSYTDNTGSNAYWYKYTFRNSTTAIETDLAASKAVRGGNNNYVSVDTIRREAGFANNRNITDVMINEKRQIAQSEVDGALSGVYTIPFSTPVNPTIENVTLQLATGYLLMMQFANGSPRYDEGKAKVDEAQSIIERLKSGQLILTGVTGVELPQTNTNTNGMSGWPDDTTAGLSPDTNGAGDFMFKRSSIDGFGTRKY
jgi:hypothetical protein